jgi:hypothetical protein
MASLQVDPKILAQVINIMKTVADNGVPAVEIARVLNDGMMPMEITEHLTKQAVEALAKDFAPADVDAYVNLYDNLRLKSNIPLDVIEHIDNSLIQVQNLYYNCCGYVVGGQTLFVGCYWEQEQA